MKTSTLLCFFLVCLFYLLVPANPAIAAGETLRIVFCNDGHTNPYHVEWLAGFEAAIKSYNQKFGSVEGHWRSASRVEEQFKQVEEEIEKGVDILFVNSISIKAMSPLVYKAQGKGIIWISVHNYMDIADYNFLLGDIENGYHQGLALATYFNGKAEVAIMLGKRGMSSGEERLQGILKALRKYPEIRIVAQEPADWSSAKALRIVDKWYSKFPNLDALSVVTDTYLYPAITVAEHIGRKNIAFFGYDGDKPILEIMKNSNVVKADILLSATREGWCFIHMAYRITKGFPVNKNYIFHTPLVLSKETYRRCLKNGFPKDIEVYDIDKALKLAEEGAIEYGPDSILTLMKTEVHEQ